MIYIIVPTFGRVEHTQNFIKTVRDQFSDLLFIITDDHPEFPNYSAFSGDPDCHVIRSYTALWWVGSINLGIEYVLTVCNDDDIIIFANNDVIIPKNNAFNDVLTTLRSNLNLIILPITENTAGAFISSGCQLKSIFPYYTYHPKKPAKDIEIDFATARFLMTSGKVVKTVREINPKLIQYHGDYYFSKKAQSYGIKTLLSPSIRCIVDDDETGYKNGNIQTLKEFLSSLKSIRSANNIKYRYILFRSFYSPIISSLIVMQMTAISFMRFFINVFRTRLQKVYKARMR